MTTCPSGVHYMHLIDHARAHVEATYTRPLTDRLLRWALAKVLPYPMRFRLAVLLAKVGRPFARLIPDARVQAMLDMVPGRLPPVSRNDDPQVFAPEAPRRMRVALMTGCAQKALNTDINDATIRLLRRLGCEVVIPEGMGCCGALTHHMGREGEAHAAAGAMIRALMDAHRAKALDAVVINTSGCGTTIKDYGHMFRTSPLAAEAKVVSDLALDITELLQRLEMPAGADRGLRVAYHAACSLQHGQQVKTAPKDLLKRAGFTVVEPADSHLCCGSAGTYNLLQPEISRDLKVRKVATLEARRPDVIAAGNIGCMMQIGSGTKVPVVHTVELLDWATGGPKPRALDAT
jgi:glycolate oxidase iron-sulfur subunit